MGRLQKRRVVSEVAPEFANLSVTDRKKAFEAYLCNPGLPARSRYGRVYRIKKLTDTSYEYDTTGADYVRQGGDPSNLTMIDPEGGPCLSVNQIIGFKGSQFGVKHKWVKILTFEIVDGKTIMRVREVSDPTKEVVKKTKKKKCHERARSSRTNEK